MTVATLTNRMEYTGNGSTTAFPVTYVFLSSADLKVYLDGTLKTLTTHYTVSGGSGSTGTVTFLTAPTTGADVVILRDPAQTQTTDLRNQGAFFAEVHEQAFDKLTMLAQRLEDKLGQTLTIPDYEQFDTSIPNAATRAGKYMAFDNDGNPSVSASDVDALAAAAEASADASAASATAAATSATAAASSATAAANVEANVESALASFNSSLDSIVPTFEQFSGTGSQTQFTLSVTPTEEDAIDIFISGVYQTKSQYSLSGSQITFTSAPPSGTNNIEVKIAPLVAYTVMGSTDFGLIV